MHVVINWESQRESKNLKTVGENLKRHISKSNISVLWFPKRIQAKRKYNHIVEALKQNNTYSSNYKTNKDVFRQIYLLSNVLQGT